MQDLYILAAALSIQIYQVCGGGNCFSSTYFPVILGGDIGSSVLNVISQGDSDRYAVGGFTEDTHFGNGRTGPFISYIKSKIQWTRVFDNSAFAAVDSIHIQNVHNTGKTPKIAATLQTTPRSIFIVVFELTGTLFNAWKASVDFSISRGGIVYNRFEGLSIVGYTTISNPSPLPYFTLFRIYIDNNPQALNNHIRANTQSYAYSIVEEYQYGTLYYVGGQVMMPSTTNLKPSISIIEESGSSKTYNIPYDPTTLCQMRKLHQRNSRDDNGNEAFALHGSITGMNTCLAIRPSNLGRDINFLVSKGTTVMYGSIDTDDGDRKVSTKIFPTGAGAIFYDGIMLDSSDGYFVGALYNIPNGGSTYSLNRLQGVLLSTDNSNQKLNYLSPEDKSSTTIYNWNNQNSLISYSIQSQGQIPTTQMLSSLVFGAGNSSYIEQPPRDFNPDDVTVPTIQNQMITVGEFKQLSYSGFQLSDCDDETFTYSLQKDGGTLPAFMQLSTPTQTITINMPTSSDIGIHVISLVGVMNDGSVIKVTFEVAVAAVNCASESFLAIPDPDDINYVVNQAKTAFVLPKFTVSSANCQATYSVVLSNGLGNIASFISTNMSLMIYTTSFNYIKDYNVTLQGLLPDHAIGTSVSFTVSIDDPCISLTFTNFVQYTNITYYIEDDTPFQFPQLAWIGNDTSCMPFTYGIIDVDTWVFADPDIFEMTIDNKVQVNTTDSLKIKLYNLQIVANAKSGASIYQNDFKVNITSDCGNAIITPSVISADTDYILGDPKKIITYSYFTISKVGCGPLEYYMLVDSQPTYPSVFIFNNPGNKLGFESNRYIDEGGHNITIVANSRNNLTNAKSTFFITFINPCKTATISGSSISPQKYTINDIPKILDIKLFSVSTSTMNCGAFTYTLTNSTNQPILDNFISVDNMTGFVTIYSQDVSLIGQTVQIVVVATLTNYTNITGDIHFWITFDYDCMKNSLILGNTVALVSYTIYDLPMQIWISNYTTVLQAICQPDLNYTCLLQDGNAVPSSIFTLDTSVVGSALTVQSDDSSENNKIYEIVVTVIDNVFNLMTGSYTVFVELKCDCRCATITPTLSGYFGSYDISNQTISHDIYTMGWTSDFNDCPVTYKILEQTNPVTETSLDFLSILNDAINLQTQSSTIQIQTYNFFIRGEVHPDKFITQTFSFEITDLCATVDITTSSIANVVYDSGNIYETQVISPWTTDPEAFCAQALKYDFILLGGTSIPFVAIYDIGSNLLSVGGATKSQAGNYTAGLRGSLTQGNTITQWFQIEVRVGCIDNELDNSTIGLDLSYEYPIYGGVKQYPFNDFNELCDGRCGSIGYNWKVNDTLTAIAPYLIFDFDITNKAVIVNTSDLSYNDTYWKITVVGHINNETNLQSEFSFIIYAVFRCYVIQVLPPTTSSEYYQRPITYRIGQGSLELDFDNFIQNDVCNFPMTYSLKIDTNLKSIVSDALITSRIITINSDNKKDGLLQEQNLQVIATVTNPNDTRVGILNIPIIFKTVNNAAPTFTTPLQDVQVIAGQSINIKLPELFDLDQDQCLITHVNLGQASQYMSGNYPDYSIETTATSFGIYTIQIAVTDDNPYPLASTYDFKLIIIKPIDSSSNNNTDETSVTDESMISQSLTAKIRSISLQGKVNVQFSTSIKVPQNYMTFDSKILMLEIYGEDGSKRMDIKFSWKINSLSSRLMDIQLSFDDSSKVSKIDPDYLRITFRGNAFFLDSKTGQAIPKNHQTEKSIPKQLRNDSNFIKNFNIILEFSQLLVGAGGTAAVSLSSMMYGTMAMNLAILLLDMSQFDILPSGSIFFYLMGTIMLAIISQFIKFIGIYSKIFMKLYQAISSRLFFNLILRIFLECYLEFSLNTLLNVYDLNFDSHSDIFSSLFAITVFIISVNFPFIIWYLMYKNIKDLKTEKLKSKIGALYMEVRVEQEDAKLCIFFSVIYVLRRLLFNISAVAIKKYPFCQIQVLIMQSIMIMVYLVAVRPFETKLMNNLEIMNELGILFVSYHLTIFTDFQQDDDIQYMAGWSLIGVTLLNMTINITIMTRLIICPLRNEFE
eukprot:403369967